MANWVWVHRDLKTKISNLYTVLFSSFSFLCKALKWVRNKEQWLFSLLRHVDQLRDRGISNNS